MEQAALRPGSGGAALLRRASRHLARRPVALIAWTAVAAILLAALLAPLIAPFEPAAKVSDATMLPPLSEGHLLGTDRFGRDVFSRILFGAQPLILVSLTAVTGAGAIGLAIGLPAGFFGGWTDQGLMRAMDLILSFPLILLAIVIVAALGPGLENVILAIIVSQVPIFARLIRALAAGEAAKEYVLAARAAGFGPMRIMLVEIAPNILGPLVVQATSVISVAAIYAAALSYLGLGIQPPAPDWGYMVKEAQELLFMAPHLSLTPGIAIVVFVTAWNFIGDDLRDVIGEDEGV